MLPLLSCVLAQNQMPCLPGSLEEFWRSPLIILILVMIGYFVIVSRMRKKQQQKRSDQLSGLKKNTRIMTIGGIYGTVVQVTDSGKVVLKIDETTNTRMTISKSAVRTVLTGKEDEDEKEDSR